MPESYLPSREADLLDFSTNFNTLIGAAPATYGLSAAQATAYDALHQAWASAYRNAVEPATRTPGAIQAKRDAKAALIDGSGGIRQLVNIIQAFPATTNEMRVNLGITVPDVEPTPVPPPSSAPELAIVSTIGRTVKIRLRDAANRERRGLPVGVDGASVLTHVGEEAPADPMKWSLAMNTSRTLVDVDFPSNVAPGSKVWLTAFWFNRRKQSGPAAAFMSTNIADGLAAAA